jgi:hypothetical protein
VITWLIGFLFTFGMYMAYLVHTKDKDDTITRIVWVSLSLLMVAALAWPFLLGVNIGMRMEE